MKNILVIGSTGQIGSELTMELRQRYGGDHVVAGYIKGAEPKGALAESGPKALADVTDGEAIAAVARQHQLAVVVNTDSNACPFIDPDFSIDITQEVMKVISDK